MSATETNAVRETFTVTDGGLIKRRVMRRVGEKVNAAELVGWKAPPASEWKIEGIARIAVAVVMTK